ncbi:MAG: hypothetical protein AB7J13_05800 [Pyrinomonadaceae bacterium]
MSDYEVFPARLSWSDAVDDVAAAGIDSRVLRLVSKPKNFSVLPNLRKLTALWCFDINEDSLEIIAQCPTIKRLYIDGLKAKDLMALARLPALEVLSLESNSKVTDLNPLESQYGLKGLGVVSFRNLHSIEKISELRELRSLALSGSMWTRMTIDMLEPLSELTHLEDLDLSNLKVKDDSLRALGGLKQLRNLNVANFYPLEEFAWLSSRLRNTKCTWFEPYIDFDYQSCKKCGNRSMVMLSGRGTSTLCKLCDNLRLTKHIDKFNKAAEN